MRTKILKTEQEYNDACERIYELIHSCEDAIDPESLEGEELELLSLLVENYEHEHYPIEAPDPVEAIKFRMEQMNLRQIDVAPLFGGKTRVSEVLHKKRPLTLRMIILLNKYLGIPLESLLSVSRVEDIEPAKREKLLNITSIREYLSGAGNVVME